MASILQTTCTRREVVIASLMGITVGVLGACTPSAPQMPDIDANALDQPSADLFPQGLASTDIWQNLANSNPENTTAILRQAVAATANRTEQELTSESLDSLEIYSLENLLKKLEEYRSASVGKENMALGLLKDLRVYAGVVLLQGNHAKFVETAYVFSQLALSLSSGDGAKIDDVAQPEKQMQAMMQSCLSQQKGQLAIVESLLKQQEKTVVDTAVNPLNIQIAVWRQHARECGLEPLFNQDPDKYQQASTLCQAYHDNPDVFKEIMNGLGFNQPEEINYLAIENYFHALEQSPALYQQFIDQLTNLRASSQIHLLQKNEDPADWQNLRGFIEQSLVHQTLQVEKKCKSKENQKMIISSAVWDVWQKINAICPQFFSHPLLSAAPTAAKIQQVIKQDCVDEATKGFFKKLDMQKLQQALEQLNSDPALYQRHFLWALSEMTAESFLKKEEKLIVNPEEKDLWVTLYNVDQDGKKTELVSHNIFSRDPMNTNPLLLAPSVLQKGDVNGAPSVYITRAGYSTQPDLEATHFTVSAGKDPNILNTSPLFPSSTKLIGVTFIKAKPDKEIEPLLLIELDQKVQAIRPTSITSGAKRLTQWPDKTVANITKLANLLAPAEWTDDYLAELEAKFVLEGGGAYTLVHPCLPGELTVGYRTVKGLLTGMMKQFFDSILSANEKGIQEAYLKRHQFAQAWSAWGMVSPTQAKDLAVFDRGVNAEPISFSELHYVSFKKTSGLFPKWQRDDESITLAHLQLRTPQVCISSPAIDKAIGRDDDRFVFLTVMEQTENEIKVLAVEKSADLEKENFQVDLKLAEKDLQFLMAGTLADSAIQFGLLATLFGVPGELVANFFNKESPFTPSQLLLIIRLRAIKKAIESGK